MISFSPAWCVVTIEGHRMGWNLKKRSKHCTQRSFPAGTDNTSGEREALQKAPTE